MLLYILNIVITVAFIIHIFKTGQERYWIFIVIILPVAGFIAYFIMVILPSLMNSRRGHQVSHKIMKMLNPQAELKEAQHQYEIAQTFTNQKRLGDAYFGMKAYTQSLAMYEQILKGLYATDPHLLLQIAKCQFHLGNAEASLQTLAQLKTHNPDFHTPDGHLYYAKGLALIGKQAEATHEFEALVKYYPGFEARVCYAEALISWNEHERAKPILLALQSEAKRAERYVRELNAESLSRMKKLLAEHFG